MSTEIYKPEWSDGTKVLIPGDLHVPIHDARACDIMMAVAADWGVESVVLQGDNVDCHSVNPHPKDPVRRERLIEEVEAGRDIWDFCACYDTVWIDGNHEKWLNNVIENNPGLHGSVRSEDLMGVTKYGFTHVAHGGQVKFGSLVIEHGDLMFKTGGSTATPAKNVMHRFPDQSTIFGHVHRMDQARQTTVDPFGVTHNRMALALGHMSKQGEHYRYAGRCPNWQQGFLLLEIWYDGASPRFTPYPVEIHRTHRGKPVVQFGGKIYR